MKSSSLFFTCCCLFIVHLLHAQNVGIGTNAPAQQLDVNGIVRLNPENHAGNAMNRLVTLDAAGDINANNPNGLAPFDAVTYDMSGRVVKPANNTIIDLPGPLGNHTVTSHFIIFSTCDISAEPVHLYFKRYANSIGAFSYSFGNTAITNSYGNTVSFSNNWGCGNITINATLTAATNTIVFSVTAPASTPAPAIYIHSGRTTMMRWQ